MYVLFLDLLIEKRLGVGENIVINKSSIVAFDSNIFFKKKESKLFSNGKYNKFIEAYGPGLLIIEMSKANSPNKNRYNVKKILINIIILSIILIYIFSITIIETNIFKNLIFLNKKEDN